MNGQLRATHAILKYTLISSNFQSPKHVIKTKDPQLAKIDIAVPRFLVGPPPKGTQDVVLTAQQVAEIIQAKEEVISSDEVQQEHARELVIIDLKEDFKVFDQPNLAEYSEASLNRQFTVQVSTNQEILHVPEGMVLQKRTPNLWALLESHVGSATLEVWMDP